MIILSLPSRQNEINDIILKENLSNCTLSYTTKTIFDATELIRSCDLLISPDTSFIHIASAIDLPTIGLFYKNNFVYWGSKSTISYVVRTNNNDMIFDEVAKYVQETYLKLKKHEK